MTGGDDSAGKGTFKVYVDSATDLTPSIGDTCNPAAHVIFNNESPKKTTVLFETQTPSWNEAFSFNITSASHVLTIQVWDEVGGMLGEAKLSLNAMKQAKGSKAVALNPIPSGTVNIRWEFDYTPPVDLSVADETGRASSSAQSPTIKLGPTAASLDRRILGALQLFVSKFECNASIVSASAPPASIPTGAAPPPTLPPALALTIGVVPTDPTSTIVPSIAFGSTAASAAAAAAGASGRAVGASTSTPTLPRVSPGGGALSHSAAAAASSSAAAAAAAANGVFASASSPSVLGPFRRTLRPYVGETLTFLIGRDDGSAGAAADASPTTHSPLLSGRDGQAGGGGALGRPPSRGRMGGPGGFGPGRPASADQRARAAAAAAAALALQAALTGAVVGSAVCGGGKSHIVSFVVSDASDYAAPAAAGPPAGSTHGNSLAPPSRERRASDAGASHSAALAPKPVVPISYLSVGPDGAALPGTAVAAAADAAMAASAPGGVVGRARWAPPSWGGDGPAVSRNSGDVSVRILTPAAAAAAAAREDAALGRQRALLGLGGDVDAAVKGATSEGQDDADTTSVAPDGEVGTITFSWTYIPAYELRASDLAGLAERRPTDLSGDLRLPPLARMDASRPLVPPRRTYIWHTLLNNIPFRSRLIHELLLQPRRGDAPAPPPQASTRGGKGGGDQPARYASIDDLVNNGWCVQSRDELFARARYAADRVYAAVQDEFGVGVGAGGGRTLVDSEPLSQQLQPSADELAAYAREWSGDVAFKAEVVDSLDAGQQLVRVLYRFLNGGESPVPPELLAGVAAPSSSPGLVALNQKFKKKQYVILLSHMYASFCPGLTLASARAIATAEYARDEQIAEEPQNVERDGPSNVFMAVFRRLSGWWMSTSTEHELKNIHATLGEIAEKAHAALGKAGDAEPAAKKPKGKKSRSRSRSKKKK